MKNKLYIIILLTIFLIPFVFADITLTNDLKEKYNLGDPISSSFDITPSQDFNGLFKLTLFCDSFDIDYFVTLIDIKQNEKITIAPPEIKPTTRMKGNCRLIASLESLNKEILEKIDSNEFEITDKLDITINLDEESLLPGETINIDGEIESTHNNPDVLSAILSFNGEQEELSINNGQFSKELNLQNNMKSGKHILFIEAKDSFENYADKAINIIVKPEISKINLELNKRSFKPQETIEIKPVIYDQADEAVLDESVLVQISRGRDELFSGNVKSYEKATYTFLQYAQPGNYNIKATSNNLETEETITIEELKKLDTKLEEEIVHVKNIGNVRYNDVVNLNLFGEEKTYILNKRIRLDPGESTTIDLSKEVSTDNYQVEVVVDNKNTTLADNVPIEDKRSLINKITGAAIAAGKGLLINNPILGSIIMIIIIALTILFFIRKRRKAKNNIF